MQQFVSPEGAIGLSQPGCAHFVADVPYLLVKESPVAAAEELLAVDAPESELVSLLTLSLTVPVVLFELLLELLLEVPVEGVSAAVLLDDVLPDDPQPVSRENSIAMTIIVQMFLYSFILRPPEYSE